MRLIKFTGHRVYGYLPLSVNFNDDLSILTGSNGSGKTTAIQLIQALLSPNLKDLASIPFDYIEILFTHNSKECSISAVQEKGKVIVSMNSVADPLVIEKAQFEEVEYHPDKSAHYAVNEVIIKNHADNPVLKAIKNLPSPVIIGLERRNEDNAYDSEEYMYEKRLYARNRQDLGRQKRQFKGSLGVSLFETELLVREAYGKIRRIEDRLLTKLRDEILFSSFDYISFESGFDFISGYGKNKLLDRRQEIEDALSKIGYRDDPKLTQKLDDFFKRIESLLTKYNADTKTINIELFANKSQLDRLSRVLELIDENNSLLNKYSRPINKLIQIVNEFFKDSGKGISIDTVGQLTVKRPSKDVVPIYALSSGERQILVMFANVIFNRITELNQENIIIIDEPEISLHIRWQEKFIESLLSASSKTQFILATHSPDIIGDYKKQCVKIN